MASLLRQLVAGPRARHAEAGLDLCYVTEEIIATSGPSQAYPQRAYRNPLDQLVGFLDAKHGAEWAIWEFRGEGTGYPDEAVYGRVRHYPWPDHHPPPFRLMPLILGGMRNWLQGGKLKEEEEEEEEESGKDGDGKESGKDGEAKESGKDGERRAKDMGKDDAKKRVVVVHCKAGKGRSGTVACSYLIAHEGWTPADALSRFTQRRMRPRFGAGVSIPSQLRWISYIDRWTNTGSKHYADAAVQVVEIHVWGLRPGVKVSVEGFADEGKTIAAWHTFDESERIVVEQAPETGWGFADMVWEMMGYSDARGGEDGERGGLIRHQDEAEASGSFKAKTSTASTPKTSTASKPKTNASSQTKTTASSSASSASSSSSSSRRKSPSDAQAEPGGMAVILRPHKPLVIPHSDINISTQRRTRPNPNLALTLLSAVGHVWFNAYFEGNGPENHAAGRGPDSSGVFSIAWDDMDGIKGSSRKGARALDRLAVVWRVKGKGDDVEEPQGGPARQCRAADWAPADDASASASGDAEARDGHDWPIEGVRCSGPTGQEPLDAVDAAGS